VFRFKTLNFKPLQMLEKTNEYYKMAEVEGKLWWYQALHYKVLKTLKSSFNNRKDIRILDAGCGTGGLMQFLLDSGYSDLTGIDLSEIAVKFCKEKKLAVSLEDIRHLRKNHPDKTFDAIICNDVLCYLIEEDTIPVVVDLMKMLNPGGILIMNLPALKVFKGTHDIGVGLLRRYNTDKVKALFKSIAKSRVKTVFWPLFLSAVIALIRTWQRFSIKRNPKMKIESDVKMPNLIVNSIFLKLTKFEFNIISKAGWGSSIFVVAINESNNRS
jgi:2-polyprenyl-3-methyl-5-hydroxy-6-metoxy-1,4-benzoquinol methylase